MSDDTPSGPGLPDTSDRPRAGAPVDPVDVSPTELKTWRIFGTSHYFRLWLAQVVSSTGDWIGLVAILAIAARISDTPEAAISLVMVARMLPGFLLAPVGGVIADRIDRRRLMVFSDLGRAAVVATLPFVTNLPMLFLASLVLEIFTLLWTPAKDASVPNLVPEDKLVAANSLGMAAGFGTFPIGAALFASLSAVADRIRQSGLVDFVEVNQEFLALWLDSLTFITSAVLVLTVYLPSPAGSESVKRIDWTRAWRDLKDGIRFITSVRIVRSVMTGLGGGLLGGAAVIPLGPVYTERALAADSAGFGLLMTGMGMGAAVGVIGLSAVQRYFPRELAFAGALVGSGVAILVVSSLSTLTLAVVVVALFGVAAGGGYVAGFTLLHENVSDELRGRTFAALYTVIRLTMVVSLTIWPLLAGGLDSLSGALFDRSVAGVSLPGVRLALWLSGLLTMVAGAIAARDVHRERQERRAELGSAEGGVADRGAADRGADDRGADDRGVGGS